MNDLFYWVDIDHEECPEWQKQMLAVFAQKLPNFAHINEDKGFSDACVSDLVKVLN